MEKNLLICTILALASTTFLGTAVGCGRSNAPEAEAVLEETAEVTNPADEVKSVPESQEAEPITEDDKTESTVEAEIENSEVETKEDQENIQIEIADDFLEKYREQLRKVISGEAYMPGDGEALRFYDCANPGYALYDIDKDGTPELFITNDTENSWRSYAVYRKEDIDIGYGTSLNGYLPDSETWVWGFDFVIFGYAYSAAEGFTKVFEVNYPVEGEESITLSYSEGEAQNVSDDEVADLLKGEISVPEDVEWIPLDKSSANIPVSSLSDTDDSASDALIESVEWTNDQAIYEYPASSNTLFTFHMSDGTIQEIDAGYDPMITGMEKVDIDNDGKDDYIIKAYYGNTAGEFEFIYAFKEQDGKVVQLYPITDTSQIADNSLGAEQLMDHISDSKIVSADDNGNKVNALEVTAVEKNVGIVSEVYHAVLIYRDGCWEEIN